MKEDVIENLLSVTKIILDKYFRNEYVIHYNIKNQFQIKNYNKGKDSNLKLIIREFYEKEN